MSVFVSDRGTKASPARLWGLVLAAAFAWVVGYAVNGRFWDWVVYDLFGFDPASRLGEAVHFFVYDTTKILLLLGGIIFIVTVMRSFITIERTRRLLGGRREGVGNVAAAGLGMVTPFCSCSAVPAFIGFVAAGVPLGVTLSFLIASPMVNEVAVILIFGMFGLKVAAMYVVFGLLVAIVAGYVLGRMHLERWVEPFVFETKLRGEVIEPSTDMPWDDRLAFGREEVKTIVVKVLPYLLVGIAVGAAIHGWAPEDLFARWAGEGNPLAVPLAVLMGIPLYSSAAGVIPLVQALADKGVALGTVLAFMMAVVALSLPEMILLRRVLQPKLLGTFVAVVGTGILAVGYLFNAVIS
ncbi:MAG: permease [Actinomycetia bacterium]|nr:permease [Actinomycetes bacterium]